MDKEGSVVKPDAEKALALQKEMKEKVDKLEEELGKVPQIDLQTQHHLSGKIYARTIFIPAGTALVGTTHKKDHMNVMFGDITVTTDEGVVRFTGYHVIPAKAGFKRAGIAHADTLWTTLCYTEETDLEKIEEESVVEVERLQTRKHLLNHTKSKELENSQCHGPQSQEPQLPQ